MSYSYTKHTCNTVIFCFPILSQLSYKPSSGVLTLLQLIAQYPPPPTLGTDANLREYHWCDWYVTWESGLAHVAYLCSLTACGISGYTFLSNDILQLGPFIVRFGQYERNQLIMGNSTGILRSRVPSLVGPNAALRAVSQKACYSPLQVARPCPRLPKPCRKCL